MALTAGGAAWKALGVGSGQGSLEKLNIRVERQNNQKESFDVLFNPNRLSYKRKVTWKPRESAGKGYMSRHRLLEFVSAVPETLALSLFFDTYEAEDDASFVRNMVVPTNPFTPAPKVADVRLHTLRLVELTYIDEHLHQPPWCELWWGKRRLFRGVLSSVNQKLTMFMPDGTPVRATVDCEFTESNTHVEAVRRRELQSADVAKTVVVRATDSLHAIAAAEYGDPAHWRLIARANGIINPRAVAPGTVLILPPLGS